MTTTLTQPAAVAGIDRGVASRRSLPAGERVHRTNPARGGPYGKSVYKVIEMVGTKEWKLFADFKEIWLSVDADGLLAGGVPVTARVKLNPSLFSAGIKFHFPSFAR